MSPWWRCLVRHGDQISLDVFRRNRRHGEHVLGDAVAFDMVEVEIAHRIVQRSLSMGEAMQPMLAIVPIVPVVKEVVVQQRGSDQGMQIDAIPQVQTVGHPYRQTSDANGMGECGHRPMLVAPSFDVHMLVFEHFTPMLVDQPLNLNSRQHRSPPSCSVITAFECIAGGIRTPSFDGMNRFPSPLSPAIVPTTPPTAT